MSGERLIQAVATVAAAIFAAWLIAWFTGIVVLWVARRRYERLLVRLHESCHRPWTVTLIVLALLITLPSTAPTGDAQAVASHLLTLALIGAVAWLATKVLFVAEEAALEWLRVDVPNNRRVRRIRTQVALLRRLTAAVIIIIAVAAMLMTFTPLQALGASLLASAGVAGAIAGLAAQTTLAQVFAGLQLAMSDQLRLDDVVVVENEWGRVEELTLTHVVVRLWDERRLVLPTTYFTSTPFQNWTRHEARVIGSVLLHVDYTAPVDDLRAEARRVIEASPLWDRRDWVVQVVDTTPSTMVVRILASAPDGPTAWDLRCDIREQLIAYLQAHHPKALPRVRIEAEEPMLVPAASWVEAPQPEEPPRRPGTGSVRRPSIPGVPGGHGS